MQQSTAKVPLDEKAREDLKIAYQAVLNEHQAISDFRSKLLALLPFATGAGIFFLIKDLPQAAPFIDSHRIRDLLVIVGCFFGPNQPHTLKYCRISFFLRLDNSFLVSALTFRFRQVARLLFVRDAGTYDALLLAKSMRFARECKTFRGWEKKARMMYRPYFKPFFIIRPNP